MSNILNIYVYVYVYMCVHARIHLIPEEATLRVLLISASSFSEYIGVQRWLIGSSVMMPSKSYGMFWFQTFASPNNLKKCCH